ncbi:MAG: hypothetical protein J07HQW2_03737, partial [Haloquadratum walsbyi J07HQW2]
MSDRTWRRPHDTARQGRDATLAQVIDTIDQTAPPTKTALADRVGISEQYLSELLQDLKTDDIVRKAYVVDNKCVYESADVVSRLHDQTASETTTTNFNKTSDTQTEVSESTKHASDKRMQTDINTLSATLTDRSQVTENEASVSVLDLLERLDTVTTT